MGLQQLDFGKWDEIGKIVCAWLIGGRHGREICGGDDSVN